MAVHFHAQGFQLLLISDGAGLLGEAGQAHAAHIQAIAPESIYQAQHIHIVGDSQVGTHLIFFDIRCIDNDDDLGMVPKLR